MKLLLLSLLLGIIFMRFEGSSGPAVRSYSTKTYNDGAFARPAGVVDGDLLVVFLVDYYDSAPPAGWTAVATNGGVDTAYATAFRRIASGEPGNYNSVFSHYSYGFMAAFENAGAGLVDAGAWDSATTGTSHENPGLTSTGGLLVALAHTSSYIGGPSTTTDPSGFTRAVDLADSYGARRLLLRAGGADGSPHTWTMGASGSCYTLFFTLP